MRVKGKLSTTVIIFLFLSSAEAGRPVNPVKSVVNEFYKQYFVFLNNPIKKDPDTSVITWVKANSLLTEEFKRKFEEVIVQARIKDPELGLDFDPIVHGQDHPDKGFRAIDSKVSGKMAVTIVEGIEWPGNRIRVELVEIKGKWLINGIGTINTEQK